VVTPVASRPGLATTLAEAGGQAKAELPPIILYAVESTASWQGSWREHRVSLSTYRLAPLRSAPGSGDG
jgi:hypothetical protein